MEDDLKKNKQWKTTFKRIKNGRRPQQNIKNKADLKTIKRKMKTT